MTKSPPVSARLSGLPRPHSPVRRHEHLAPGPSARSSRWRAPGGLPNFPSPGPRLQGPRGEGLSRCAGSVPCRAAAAPRPSGRAPLLLLAQQGPAPTGTAAPGSPGKSCKTRGKPPCLTQADHRSLIRAEAAERSKERLSAPPS
ncbi:hypothetical protein NDU88_002425 [Pleurodeles waltl]|uniref:Uncharacterized protein n=1 Tax=Pleurodeles waltl TaxID=8319 RepID=A0AAV7KSN0_PLEWA|nr:hypothetical protein NDU88_002425 [Pleurodeles waltl]